jgi:hypothetical protein
MRRKKYIENLPGDLRINVIKDANDQDCGNTLGCNHGSKTLIRMA